MCWVWLVSLNPDTRCYGSRHKELVPSNVNCDKSLAMIWLWRSCEGHLRTWWSSQNDQLDRTSLRPFDDKFTVPSSIDCVVSGFGIVSARPFVICSSISYSSGDVVPHPHRTTLIP